MPPLSLSTDELDLLRSLAEPIARRRRAAFLAAVAAELEARGQAGGGPGLMHRTAREMQRRYFDPPDLSAGKYARP
ncbi:hypothetical protein SAMN05444161_0004 [Rhizobiales bacterium GAS191]|nr:hypothetical protein SAMN05444161_0004 [Rhizobiales bacterium GAS191]